MLALCIQQFRPRPRVCVFIWKRNIFVADTTIVHTYTIKNDERKRSYSKTITYRIREDAWKPTELFDNIQ